MLSVLLVCCLLVSVTVGSSHSEAPGTSRGPNTDLTDVYAFMTRRGNLGLVMNVAGLTQSQSGPNYGPLNNDFVYQIHLDNNADAIEDISFQFLTGYRYTNNGRGIEVPVGKFSVPIPLGHIAINPVTYNATTGVTSGLNTEEYYHVRVLYGNDESQPIDVGPFLSTMQAGENTTEFTKAFNNAGTKTFPPKTSGGYEAYEDYVNGAAIYTNVTMPGCNASHGPISVFVGPRRESFGIALGEVFDGINVDPAPAGELGTRANTASYDGNSIDRFNVISFVLEIPIACTRVKSTGVLGVWSSVKKVLHSNAGNHFAGEQTTRLGNPLVNELLIGTTFKNEWNARPPAGDDRYNVFYTNPVLPTYIQALFGAGSPANQAAVIAPTTPRNDLSVVLLDGIPGINNQGNASDGSPVPSDLLRINVSLATFVECSAQNPLGVIAGDTAGFPNGRRLGDDVVDIYLRVAMGVLCPSFPTLCPNFTAGAGAKLAPLAPVPNWRTPIRRRIVRVCSSAAPTISHFSIRRFLATC
jgi:hypothetical protein